MYFCQFIYVFSLFKNVLYILLKSESESEPYTLHCHNSNNTVGLSVKYSGCMQLKGTVDPKIKIQSLSTHSMPFESWWRFFIHAIFLELHSKLALIHSPKQLKKLGCCFKGQLKITPPKNIKWIKLSYSWNKIKLKRCYFYQFLRWNVCCSNC